MTDLTTPARAGFHLPAEWEPHRYTWMAWPHNLTDWPGKVAPVRWAYAEMVRKLAPGEIVRILVQTPAHEAGAVNVLRRAGVDLDRVELVSIPTNRGWTRDFGPIFVRRGPGPTHQAPEVAIARFKFNAWARYPDWRLDNQVPERVAEMLRLTIFPIQASGRDVVLEGGAIDVNGCGTLLATEECLLGSEVQERNPGLSRADMESVLRESLGVSHILWLGRGIAGDDTHGHIDDLCRFVNPTTVVLAQEDSPADDNYVPLQESRERLEGMRLQDGSHIQVAPIPMPEPLWFDGVRLPASYANFYIANAAVLVPTFNDPHDRTALGILADLFPDRAVIGIHAVDLLWGFGAVHCLTQQQPAPLQS